MKLKIVEPAVLKYAKESLAEVRSWPDWMKYPAKRVK